VRPASGTRRGCPDLAPVVSNSTTSWDRTPILSSAATNGFMTIRPTRRSNLNLRRALSAIVAHPFVAEVHDDTRTITQVQHLAMKSPVNWHALAMAGTPETLYARDGDLYLAYQVAGG